MEPLQRREYSGADAGTGDSSLLGGQGDGLLQ